MKQDFDKSLGVVFPQYTSTKINELSKKEGMIVFNKDLNSFEYYNPVSGRMDVFSDIDNVVIIDTSLSQSDHQRKIYRDWADFVSYNNITTSLSNMVIFFKLNSDLEILGDINLFNGVILVNNSPFYRLIFELSNSSASEYDFYSSQFIGNIGFAFSDPNENQSLPVYIANCQFAGDIRFGAISYGDVTNLEFDISKSNGGVLSFGLYDLAGKTFMTSWDNDPFDGDIRKLSFHESNLKLNYAVSRYVVGDVSEIKAQNIAAAFLELGDNFNVQTDIFGTIRKGGSPVDYDSIVYYNGNNAMLHIKKFEPYSQSFYANGTTAQAYVSVVRGTGQGNFLQIDSFSPTDKFSSSIFTGVDSANFSFFVSDVRLVGWKWVLNFSDPDYDVNDYGIFADSNLLRVYAASAAPSAKVFKAYEIKYSDIEIKALHVKNVAQAFTENVTYAPLFDFSFSLDASSLDIKYLHVNYSQNIYSSGTSTMYIAQHTLFKGKILYQQVSIKAFDLSFSGVDQDIDTTNNTFAKLQTNIFDYISGSDIVIDTLGFLDTKNASLDDSYIRVYFVYGLLNSEVRGANITLPYIFYTKTADTASTLPASYVPLVFQNMRESNVKIGSFEPKIYFKGCSGLSVDIAKGNDESGDAKAVLNLNAFNDGNLTCGYVDALTIGSSYQSRFHVSRVGDGGCNISGTDIFFENGYIAGNCYLSSVNNSIIKSIHMHYLSIDTVHESTVELGQLDDASFTSLTYSTLEIGNLTHADTVSWNYIKYCTIKVGRAAGSINMYGGDSNHIDVGRVEGTFTLAHYRNRLNFGYINSLVVRDNSQYNSISGGYVDSLTFGVDAEYTIVTGCVWNSVTNNSGNSTNKYNAIYSNIEV